MTRPAAVSAVPVEPGLAWMEALGYRLRRVGAKYYLKAIDIPGAMNEPHDWEGPFRRVPMIARCAGVEAVKASGLRCTRVRVAAAIRAVMQHPSLELSAAPRREASRG